MPTEQALVSRLADRFGERRDAVVADLVRMTLVQIDDLDHDAATRSLLEASITENVVAALNFVGRDFDADLLEAPSAALAYARILAQRDVSLSALVRAYRIGHSRVLDDCFTLAEELPAEDRVAVVLALVRRSALYIDQICEQVGRAYERERERWVASQDGERRRWVGSLLDGGPVDRAAAERALRYPLDAVHVACALWPSGRMTSFDLLTAVDEVRAHATAVLRARAALVVPTDEREVRLWLALPARGGADRVDLAPPEGTSLHAAVGRPGAGLEGFRSSARQAARVREVLGTRSRGAGGRDAGGRSAGGRGVEDAHWVHYADVAPVALMAGDPAAVRDFVTATLGELAEPGARGAVLRETLRVFLARRRSHAAAATALNLHRNSVQYRVRQASALLPGGARDLDDDFSVRAALLAAQWLGDTVLA
ncbi:helix-turn-helix domain-containing protein [Streptomyces sp. DSM 110735]|uniref:PucR family transcriptional regulator n=1 Tax=Streptomyces sp. DSM 110735 TaxID=2775031 RepID=UPI0018F50D7D|nr:helix-turn-helix domain-containing protein [Streptomyces sp. DSM 110735]MBJ7906973.1 helix-turn-helix domain-containing protein [Streptomyces sp. DSM 110735]